MSSQIKGYRLVPINPEFVSRVRQTGLDDLNQPAERSIAVGGEPCRDSLRRALPGEELILASYCPFQLAGPYKEFGPVFIHAEGDPIAPDLTSLPLEGPRPYFAATFVLRAYSQQERIADAVLTSAVEAEANLISLLERPDTAFVLARFGAYGCYACRIERFS